MFSLTYTGGPGGFLERNPKVTVYLPGSFSEKYFDKKYINIGAGKVITMAELQ